MKKKRIITSFSDVITNSSTQVFFLDIEEKLLEYLRTSKKNNQRDLPIVITGKEDLIRLIEESEKTRDYSVFELIYHVIGGNWYDLVQEYGKGILWEELNNAGKTDREIVEFIWPLIKDVQGKVFYSFADDCGTPKVAEELWDLGYNSQRQ